MKKIFISLFSFILVLAGGIFSTQSFALANDNEQTLYEVTDGETLVNVLTNEAVYQSENNVIILKNDIDMEGVDTSPISLVNGNFIGIFEGNGYTISNLTLASATQYFGLLPRATGATIQNVKIDGNINFTFSTTNTKEIYAGVLVGSAENVIFNNCEFDSSKAEDKTIELPIYSDFNFGMLAGKVKGNPIANSSGNRANIRDCVNYYNFDIALNNQTNTYVGGLVGNAQNVYILNTLNFGNIKFTNNTTLGGDSENTNKEYLGGIAGTIAGSGMHVRNSCFAGVYDITSIVTSLKLYYGAILGGVLDNSVSKENINFVYFTDGSLVVAGDKYVTSSEKVKCVGNINRAFLTDVTNFDEQSQNQPFDFGSVWSLAESRFHLQKFMTFDFGFKTVLHQTIESAKIYVNENVQVGSYTARHGSDVRIDFAFKPQYVGYYKLAGITLSNLDFDMNKADIVSTTNSRGQITGYSITVKADATTSGSYAFSIQSVTYNCVATISDEAKEQNQGGVRVADSSITVPTTEMSLLFTYNSEIKKIVAEGTTGSVYAFDCWKLYYKDEATGEFSTSEVQFANSTDSMLSIAFGTAPFDREFKLVAHFTDENAILVSFGEINPKRVVSIKFGGIEYTGDPIAVSPNHSKNLEVVTAKNYKLNVELFMQTIQKLYGENSTETLITADPEINENGETVYKYSLNMRYMGDLSKNSLNLVLTVEKDDSNSKDDLLWLWITIPCVGVLLIGIIVLIIVRRRRNYTGKGGKGGKAPVKVKERKVSYKDFY